MSKEPMKNLTCTIRTILVRSLFEEDMDIDAKPNLLEGGGGSQGQPKVKKPRTRIYYYKRKTVKKVKEKRPPRNKKVLNYVATKLEEEEGYSYTCITCSFVTPDLNTIKFHQGEHQVRKGREVEGEERLPCPHCGRTYKDSKSLWSHISVIHNKKHQDGEKVCPHCGRTFQRYGSLSRHIRLMHDEAAAEKQLCPQCGKTFKTSINLKHHIRNTHNSHIRNTHDSQGHLCPQCGKTYKTPATLKSHIRHTHNKNREHLCPQCGRTFKHSKSLGTHVCGKRPDSEYSCSSCGQKFTTINARMVHERSVHEGLPVYKCPEPGCPRVYGLFQRLQVHRRSTHRNVRPFVCERCGKRFKNKSAWLFHGGSRCNDNAEEREKIKDIMRRQKKWRKCDQCDFKTFGVTQQLNKHVKNMHKKDNVQNEGMEVAVSENKIQM